MNLQIANIGIRQDAAGRYCLNDIHKAAVEAGHDYKTCQVEHFTRNDSTQGLLDEILKNGELKSAPFLSLPGRYGGTWACKEIVYAYAMWISPVFNLKVIRAYDAIQSIPSIPQSLPEALRLAANLAEQNALLAPKAEIADRLSIADGSLCITDAAKSLQVRPKDLFDVLKRRHWVYSRTGKAGYIARQPTLMQGWLEHKVTTISRNDGSEKITEQVRVTPKGLIRLAKIFNEEVTA